MIGSLKLALAQVHGSPHPERNLETAEAMMREAADRGADCLVFPEMFMALPRKGRSLADVAETLDGTFVTSLAQLASQHGMHVVSGVWQSSHEADRVYNTAVVISPSSGVMASYRKLHLFDALEIRESDKMVPGDSLPPVVHLNGLQIGIAICYDLRFPELFRSLARRGAQCCILPSAWYAGLLKEEHWLTLLRARAIENTFFMAGVNLVGGPFCGRSCVCDPFGVQVASAGENQQLLVATLQLDRVNEVRAKLPSLDHCRFELFSQD